MSSFRPSASRIASGRPRVARLACAAVCLAGVAVAAQKPAEPPHKRDADRLSEKLEQILALGAAPTGAKTPSLVTLTEPEVNAYLFWHLEEVLPSGVTEPYVWLEDAGAVRGRAVVDLTAIRQQKARGWLDPLAYVSGRVPVTVSGVVRSAAGVATLELSSVTVAGVQAPKSVLQELVSFYTRSAARPQGLNLDAPFPLPAGIKQVKVEQGRAVVVQ